MTRSSTRDTEPCRPLLIHSHIFKNAGTSLDRLLSESFGASWTQYESPFSTYRETDVNGLNAFLETRPTVRAVSSHLPLGFLSVPHCVPLVILRHPIERAHSVFRFLARDTTQEDHLGASGSFGDYVTWALDTPGKGVAVRNYQVFHLSDAPLRRENVNLATTDHDLAWAKAQLASLPAFGMVRHFALSCRVFEACYASIFPELRLYEVRENASADAATETEDEAIDAARAELGEKSFARLCEANQLDLELYRFASAEFEKRFVAKF